VVWRDIGRNIFFCSAERTPQSSWKRFLGERATVIFALFCRTRIRVSVD